MSSYRTKKRAVVHPLRSAKAFQPYCSLDFRNEREMKGQIVQYMRPFCGQQRVEIDTATRGILVDGEHRYTYELIDPAPAKTAAAVMH